MTPFLAVLIPFLGAAAIGLAANRPRLRDGLCFALPVPLFLTVVGVLIRRVGGDDAMEQTLVDWIPGVSITLSAQPLGLIFALLASTLYIVATPYAIGYLRAGG